MFMEGCARAKTSLIILIISHPQGGYEISILSCTFQGKLETHGGGIFGSKEPRPITAFVEWWWEDGYHQNAQVIKSETYTFTSKEPVMYTTTYSAPPGYVLLNYFWVKIKWTDEDGTPHTIESAKAYCYCKKSKTQREKPNNSPAERMSLQEVANISKAKL